MASSLAKSNKNFRRAESRNKHSWWWDSHISAKNSKWLAENLEEMDQSVKRMLKLIEEEGDSFAKKAEMYYQKRPELVSHVEEFYRMYRSLAERYDNVTGELRKNIPSDLQSQGSGVSDGSEPPSTVPNHRLGRRGSGTRAAGFDVFLKTGGSSSDLGTKEGDETSTLDSESESDDSSVNNYSSTSANSDSQGLRKRTIELEKIQTQQEEKIRVSEEMIEKLRNELQKYESMAPEDIKEAVFLEQISSLEVELNATREKLTISEEEVKRLKREVENKDISGWKSKVDKEKREVSKLQDRIMRYKANLAEREREIRGLKETLSNANKSLSEENQKLEEQLTKMVKERALLDDTLKELDLKCQCSEEELRRVKAVKTEMEQDVEGLKLDIREVEGELSVRDREIEGLERHLEELHVDNAKLVCVVEESKRAIEGLKCKCGELEGEVKRQREVIEAGGEEKREVIRQLCFSLEHYRDGYQTLRRVFLGHNKRRPVMAL